MRLLVLHPRDSQNCSKEGKQHRVVVEGQPALPRLDFLAAAAAASLPLQLFEVDTTIRAAPLVPELQAHS
eukprot:CAMPEP_0206522498 /NCGR_PEP_ID=MMETSP0324_2-20121206/67021_1 /ASSEMBLY_ACC=CAM_ASM_000836 /TAXON_ID=2866 /ORGANISM="Crypthecodinium cohnii, Strain Seligo" /LENGTH=69 /DNA_ID=CAMNT_0054016679 /DNA_START=778 /DNA_END=987 /DNA_ORIENTATION=+